VPVPADKWNPEQYTKFAAERSRPFFDLLDMVQVVPGGDVVDLGCGTGELTARLHEHVQAGTTLGLDSSEAMLAKARPISTEILRFERGDISEFDAEARFDIVFANASLQWVPEHPRLLGKLARALRPAGQLAVQVPANFDHPSHALAAEIAQESPFREYMGEATKTPAAWVLTPERYGELLNEIGFGEQHVRLQVYGHNLTSSAAVVEWTRGTALLRFEESLSPELFEVFLERYRCRLLEVLGEKSPYFYAFKRILFWARLPGPDGAQ